MEPVNQSEVFQFRFILRRLCLTADGVVVVLKSCMSEYCTVHRDGGDVVLGP